MRILALRARIFIQISSSPELQPTQQTQSGLVCLLRCLKKIALIFFRQPRVPKKNSGGLFFLGGFYLFRQPFIFFRQPSPKKRLQKIRSTHFIFFRRFFLSFVYKFLSMLKFQYVLDIFSLSLPNRRRRRAMPAVRPEFPVCSFPRVVLQALVARKKTVPTFSRKLSLSLSCSAAKFFSMCFYTYIHKTS